jgi:proline dehydrogenase
MLNDALRGVLLRAAGSGRLRQLVESAPITRSVVSRFVAGTPASHALRACR